MLFCLFLNYTRTEILILTIVKDRNVIYTIYLDCCIIQNLFLQVLESVRKASVWQAFVACFATSAIIYVHPAMSKSIYNCQISLKDHKLILFLLTFSSVSSIMWALIFLWVFFLSLLMNWVAEFFFINPWLNNTEVFFCLLICSQNCIIAR